VPVSQQLADRLQRATGGNPLALLELAAQRQVLDDLALGAPLVVATRVANVYTQRYRSLSDRTQHLLALVATSETGELPLLSRAAAPLGWNLSDLVPAETAGADNRQHGPRRVLPPAGSIRRVRRRTT
jgi:hypothetical protein